MVPQVPAAIAAPWVARWERQQRRYAVGREARTDAIVALIAGAVAEVADPVVVELGCGPGQLTQRIRTDVTDVQVVGVDADPFLLALAEATAVDGTRFVHAMVGADGWVARLALDGPPEVVVSTTTLHYLSERELREVYGDLAALLEPGSLLINGDHLRPASRRLDHLAESLRDAPEGEGEGEDWAGWWQGVREDPHLGAVLRELAQPGPVLSSDHLVSAERHVELLRAAGFAEVGTLWRHGPSAVMVAVR